MTQGAAMQSQRSAARKVSVRRRPCGVFATSRSPLGARPWVRVMLVLAPGLVDEDQTGRIKPPLILFPLRPSPGDVGTILLAGVQAFFEADALVLEEVPDREVTHLDPAFRKLCRQRPQRDVRLYRPSAPKASSADPAPHKAAGRQPCAPPRSRSPGTAATTSLRWQR